MPTFQLPRFWLKLVAPAKAKDISVTCAMFQAPILTLNVLQLPFANKFAVLVTAAVFQLAIGPQLKEARAGDVQKSLTAEKIVD